MYNSGSTSTIARSTSGNANVGGRFAPNDTGSASQLTALSTSQMANLQANPLTNTSNSKAPNAPPTQPSTSKSTSRAPSDTTDNTNIYSTIPDQFTRYEDVNKNNFDYFTSSGEFNLALFNKTFREEQLKRVAFYKKLEEDRLNELNKTVKPKLALHEISVAQHIFNMKDTIFNILSDLQTQPLSMDILLKDYRLFYIGLFFVILFLIYLIFRHLVGSN
jgi:hypothetical protein